MFERILVPLDGSARAWSALPVVARLARASGGSLHLLEVVSPPIDYGGGLAMVPLLSEQVVESGTTAATAYLQTVTASPMLAGIQTTTEVVFGIPTQYILAVAKAGEVDLIVLCSHGRTGFTRWVLGSVAHTLAHESPVPTLVLRESELTSRLVGLEASRPLRALVPLDGSPLAEAALAPAARLVAALAAPAQGELHLAQVVRRFSATAEEVASERNDEASARASTYLAQKAERLQTTAKDFRLSITWSVICAENVAGALVSLAEQGGEGRETEGRSGCDLIAISTHGRHGLQRWVMGSVTDRLLATTKLPVLIVRPQQRG